MENKQIAINVFKVIVVGLCQVVGFAVPAVGLLSVGLAAGRKAMFAANLICLLVSSLVLASSLTGEFVVLAYIPILEPVFKWR